MRNSINASEVGRGAVLPVVAAVGCLAVLLVTATMGVRPWFVRWFDWLDGRGVGHADIDVVFRHFGILAAVVFVAALLVPGVLLLRRAVCRAQAVLWYGALSAVALTGWGLWMALVFHNTCIALFTR
jgi:hypothetical protein